MLLLNFSLSLPADDGSADGPNGQVHSSLLSAFNPIGILFALIDLYHLNMCSFFVYVFEILRNVDARVHVWHVVGFAAWSVVERLWRLWQLAVENRQEEFVFFLCFPNFCFFQNSEFWFDVQIL
jgi:hypothetical protein